MLICLSQVMYVCDLKKKKKTKMKGGLRSSSPGIVLRFWEKSSLADSEGCSLMLWLDLKVAVCVAFIPKTRGLFQAGVRVGTEDIWGTHSCRKCMLSLNFVYLSREKEIHMCL